MHLDYVLLMHSWHGLVPLYEKAYWDILYNCNLLSRIHPDWSNRNRVWGTLFSCNCIWLFVLRLVGVADFIHTLRFHFGLGDCLDFILWWHVRLKDCRVCYPYRLRCYWSFPIEAYVFSDEYGIAFSELKKYCLRGISNWTMEGNAHQCCKLK